MSPDDVLQAATVAARRFAGRRGDDPRNWVGVAWERLHHANRRGVLSSFGGAVFVGTAACVDRLRAESGWVRRLGCVRSWESIDCHDDDDRSDGFHPLAPDDSETRVYRLWGETRRLRVVSGMTLRDRVMLYLWAVERWTKKDIADSFGFTESVVSLALSSVVPTGLRHPEKDADQKAWVTSRSRKLKRRERAIS